MFENYIIKRPEDRKVRVSARPAPDGKIAQTRYRVLAQASGLSLVECELLTGRTHQIRAQMAFAGHPLLGDSQYGDAKRNARYNRGYQALCAYRLRFNFDDAVGPLAAIAGREFTASLPGFVREYFPEYQP